MSEWVTLQASDGTELQAYVARPKAEIKAMLVVVQEIFGVNKHIQSVADDWANDGFLCIAPQMFDRIEKGVDLSYDKAGWEKAMSFLPKIDMDKSMIDMDAAIDWLRNETELNVGVIGFCYGGTVAWLSAARLKIEAAVGYYGGNIANFLNEEPQCPVMLHFGADDAHIPEAKIDAIRNAHPEVPIFVYEDAGHAFNRSQDKTAFNSVASRSAKLRSLRFFEQHLVF